jgi:hypothetical protein
VDAQQVRALAHQPCGFDLGPHAGDQRLAVDHLARREQGHEDALLGRGEPQRLHPVILGVTGPRQLRDPRLKRLQVHQERAERRSGHADGFH